MACVLAALLAIALGQPAHAQSSSVTRTVTFEYDLIDGLLKKEIVEPDDPTYRVSTEYERNAHGAITKRTTTWQDPLGEGAKTRIETTGYDAKSRFATAVTNAKGHTETRVHDEGTGNLTSLTGPNSLATTWQYDGWGRQTRETRADGTATSTAYRKCIDACSFGAIAVRITQNWSGASQTTVPNEEFSDALGRTVRSRSWSFDGSAVLEERAFDAAGRLEKAARPRLATAAPVWTFYDRDAIGRVTQIRAPHASGSGFDTTAFAYSGPALTTTNAKGQTRTELRNGLGKLKSVTDTHSKTTTYLYDPFGNLARTTDPLGNQINVSYDRLGRKSALADPDLGSWSYVVDPLGQTRRQTDAKAQQTSFEYDALGRLTRRLEADLDSRWEYDTATKGIGQLAEAFTWAGGTKDYRRLYSYDSLGRPSNVTSRLDWDYSTSTAYDGFGRPSSETHARNAIGGSGGPYNRFTYAYNARGYRDSFTRSTGTSTSLAWKAVAQDAEGRTTREEFDSNGAVKTAHTFNAYTGRLGSITAGLSDGAGGITPSHQNDSYTHDSLGNLTSRTQLAATAGASITEMFDHDSLNRLVYSQVAGQAAKSYSYDELGNLRSKSNVGTYEYPAAGAVRPHAHTRITGSVAGILNPTFTYDANGNLDKGLNRQYAWSAANLPVRIDKLSNPQSRTEFLYGPERQRLRQTIAPLSGGVPGAPTTTIHYAGAIEKEVDTAANRTTIRTYMPQGAGYLEERITGTAVAPTASATRGLRFFLRDHLGLVARGGRRPHRQRAGALQLRPLGPAAQRRRHRRELVGPEHAAQHPRQHRLHGAGAARPAEPGAPERARVRPDDGQDDERGPDGAGCERHAGAEPLQLRAQQRAGVHRPDGVRAGAPTEGDLRRAAEVWGAAAG